MIICKICNLVFKDLRNLGKHIYHSHKNISREDYYNEFISIVNPICICGEKKKFRSLGEGYRQYCSVQCRSNNIPVTKYWKDKKQPKSLIEKRIKNTDQKKKEEKRKSTSLLKYGIDNPSKLLEIKEKISNLNTGRKIPRKKNQQEKIIESKRLNGTLKHSKETKEKIRNSINKLYQSENPPITISENNHRNHKTGYFNGIFYRSSYELKFMEYCALNSIEFRSAENKEFRLKYSINDKNHWYYPDFYLEKYDVIIEIKPDSMLTDEVVLNKINVGMQNYRFFIITEEELYNLDDFFEELESEYLHFG